MHSTSPVNAHVETVLLTVFVQLMVIIAASRLFGSLFRRLGQPTVCGEVAAGLVLGPSLLGGLFPDVLQRIFDPSVGQIFSVMSQLGLVLMMFVIGLEFDFGHLDENRRTALSVSLAGIVVPFSLGFGLGYFMHPRLGLTGSWFNFALFMAAAMSITAIPVLGRIMIELNLQRTKIGSITISAAAIGDAVGWIILAIVTAVVKASFDAWKLALMIGEVVAFGLFMILAVRPLLIRWCHAKDRYRDGELSLNSLAILLIMILACATVTNLIGIFSIFGAFLFGSILYDQHEFVNAVKRRLSDFVTVFFLPIFFTYTGLRTDMGSMNGVGLWLMCGLVSLAAIIGKLGGCSLAARWNGTPWRESSIIGALMNTRGLMELIVINMGYDLGVIPKSVFFMLVFMAVATTYMTTPLARRLIRGSELEAEYSKSEMARRELTSA